MAMLATAPSIYASSMAMHHQAMLASPSPVNAAKALQLAKTFAKDGKWNLQESDMNEAFVRDFVVSKEGFAHAYVQQNVNGYEVFNGIMGLHFKASGELVFSTNRAEANVYSRFAAHSVLTKDFAINFQTSMRAKSQNQTGDITVLNTEFSWLNDAVAILAAESNFLPSTWNYASNQVIYNETKGYVKTAAMKDANGNIQPCVNLIFFDVQKQSWRSLYVGQNSENLWVKWMETSWTNHCSVAPIAQAQKGAAALNHFQANANTSAAATGTKNVSRRGNDGASYLAVPVGMESPLYALPDTITNPADNAASPYGWHDVNGSAGAEYTITRGNNVYASEDVANKNTPGKSPNGGSSLQFLPYYSYAERNPTNYQDFAIVNLFFANNIMHDITYHYGFDEVSGNFQQKNYSGQGSGLDAVNADAQDGSGTNNANFSTPPDGSAPRMQMYVWDGISFNAQLQGPNGILMGAGITDGKWGKTLTSVPVTGKLTWVVDNNAGKTHQGCTQYFNGDSMKGKIAAIDRGNCTFVQKVYRAQGYGAKAVVLLDTSNADVTITMATDNTSQSTKITIPVIFIKKSDAEKLRAMLKDSSFDVSFYDSSAFAKKTDSDLDFGVIAHEFAHGISNRLTCGPSNSNGLSNNEQMGEGWSDFIALAFTAKKGDVGSTPRGMANWLVGDDKDGAGIRTYPYSTNMAINPHTYGNVAAKSVAGATEVHYLGEIWCAMLWDMYWDFVTEYGFDEDLYAGKGGNNMAIQLVMDAMKLQACGPGFVDGRDAILAADEARYGGANKDLIWKAFARRGLGYSAAQGDPDNCADGEESFDMPPSASIVGNLTTEQNFKVWPNPASQQFVVEARNYADQFEVKLLDLQGRNIALAKATNQSQSVQLDVSKLPAALYLVVVTNGQGQVLETRKLIKK